MREKYLLVNEKNNVGLLGVKNGNKRWSEYAGICYGRSAHYVEIAITHLCQNIQTVLCLCGDSITKTIPTFLYYRNLTSTFVAFVLKYLDCSFFM